MEPLQEESFLSDDDMQQLFGNIEDIIRFQKLFLNELEQSLCGSDDIKVQKLRQLVVISSVDLPSLFFVKPDKLTISLWSHEYDPDLVFLSFDGKTEMFLGCIEIVDIVFALSLYLYVHLYGRCVCWQ